MLSPVAVVVVLSEIKFPAVAATPTDKTSTLDEVIENCRDLACDADLYDAAGFRKGYVAADGTYTLT